MDVLKEMGFEPDQVVFYGKVTVGPDQFERVYKTRNQATFAQALAALKPVQASLPEGTPV